jgi:hypothetical protein
MSPTTNPAAARVEEAASVSVAACVSAAGDIMAALSRLQDCLSELQAQIIDEFERKSGRYLVIAGHQRVRALRRAAEQ